MNPSLMLWAKTGVKRILRRAGHATGSSSYLHKYCFGFHLAELFQSLRIECVLDVGAHMGGYRDFLRNEVGFKGLIVSFEPVGRHVEVLRARALSDPRWVINPFALGATSGGHRMNVMHQGVFSSFLQPDHSSVTDFAETNRVTHEEDVRMETLDSVLDGLRATYGFAATYLKIDTQGYDMQVIEGSRRSLPGIAALQTEVSVRPIYRGMPDFNEAYSALAGLGFDLTGFYPVTRDSKLRVVELDCVMVNRRFVV